MPNFTSRWERLLGATDSPIESRFLSAFCEIASDHGFDISKAAKRFCIRIEPQKQLRHMRLDFLISYLCDVHLIEIAVECDGHDFHERTPQQASKDRARDRAIQLAGIKIFRFTGAEIYADSRSCAIEVLNVIEDFQTKTIVSEIRKNGGPSWHEYDQ